MENAQIDQSSHPSDKEVGEKALYPARTTTGESIRKIEQVINQCPRGRMITGQEARSSRPFCGIQDFCGNIERVRDAQGFRNFFQRTRCYILFHRDSNFQITMVIHFFTTDYRLIWSQISPVSRLSTILFLGYPL